MEAPKFEYKINVVSLANFAALISLLGVAMTSYSTLVTNWTVVQTEMKTFRDTQVSIQRELQTAAAERKVLYERDTTLQLQATTFQAGLTAKLTNLETELRVLNATVIKLEDSVDRLAGGVGTRRR